MRLEQAAPDPAFARHETFHLRYGWLKKCHDYVKRGGSFQSERAPVDLGVGKNMAKSIRFWGLAAKIIEQRGGRKDGLDVTDMGKAIFDDRRGADPYLERGETAWVIHWLLFAPPTILPVWWSIMNEMPMTRVATDEMLGFAREKIAGVPGWDSVKQSSVKKDVDAFAHTYAVGKNAKAALEDYLDSPLRSTGIVRRNAVDGTLRFVDGVKPGMSSEVVAYACLDFLSRRGVGSRLISVGMLAEEPGGPGRVLRLGGTDLLNMLHEAAGRHGGIMKVRDVNGTPHMEFGRNLREAASSMFSIIYEGRKTKRAVRKAVSVVAKRRGGGA